MTAPGYVSPCHGAPVHINATTVGPGTTAYYVCEACGQPCDPMPREVRDRIVAEGMRRALGMMDSKWQNTCRESIRREADRLAPKRRDIPTSPDNQEATDGRKSTT